MNVPFTLSPRSDAEPASALLLPSMDAADLFALKERLGLEVLPPVFVTADGLLLKLAAPLESPVGGAIRLRQLSEHLYLPVDADLLPALLPDEAKALVLKRGLVFLPGQRVLEFPHDRPLSWNDLLQIDRPTRGSWDSLPETPPWIEEPTEVTLANPPPELTVLLEQGREEMGTESPRPGGESPSGIGARVFGSALFGLGQGIAWLGTKMGSPKWAQTGANLLQKAFSWMPALSEKLMGAQEAMLRNLLKDFREGRLEKAMRRALPIGGKGSGPIAGDARLPTHNLFYSLQNLLGGRGTGGSVWFTPNNLYFELQAEYRKQAEESARRGDYRRAAFIYAKLMNDFASAARILSQGGLHRDAAVIYTEALQNLRTAAQEWEAAGEIDKAELIFLGLDDPLSAGDLLQRVGETERALVHYRRACGKLASSRKFFEAGELLRQRAQRSDLALDMYALGWKARPDASALPCGRQLAQHFSGQAQAESILALMKETEEVLADWPLEPIVPFLNDFVRLANAPAMDKIADELKDRVLLSMARLMQHHDRLGSSSIIISAVASASSSSRRDSLFFPASTPWPTPVVRDALFALKEMAKVAAPIVRKNVLRRVLRLGNSSVRAVFYMPGARDLFVGFENGVVIRYIISKGAAVTVMHDCGPILGLTADRLEDTLICLSQWSAETVLVRCATRSKMFLNADVFPNQTSGPARLLATGDGHPIPFFGVIANHDVHFFRRDNPSWRLSLTPSDLYQPRAGIVWPNGAGFYQGGFSCLLFFDGFVFAYFNLPKDKTPQTLDIPSSPGSFPHNTLVQPLVQGGPACCPVSGQDGLFKAQWVDAEGRLQGLYYPPVCGLPSALESSKLEIPFVFVPGLHELKKRERLGKFLEDQWQVQANLTNPVAAFIDGARQELLVLESNGELWSAPLLTDSA